MNFIHGYKKLNEGETKYYLEKIDSVKSNPYNFISEKFDSNNVVFVGEIHFRKQDPLFVGKLIAHLYATKKIKYFGWEFGAHEFQQLADSIVNAKEFDRGKAIFIMRNSYFAWNFEEYLQIFKTIWEINNKCINVNDRIKFLQLNSVYSEKNLKSQDTSIRNKYYRSMFDLVLPSIIDTAIMAKNEKILIYCGLHHAFTKFKTPLFLFLKPNGGLRAGENLLQKYPGRIYMTALSSAVPGKWTLLNNMFNREFDFVYPFSAVFNQLYEKYQQPFAVDANNSVFGEVKDYKSWYAFDKFNGLRLKEFCDGYIVLNSFEEVEPVELVNDWVNNEIELNEIKDNMPFEKANTIKNITKLDSIIAKETGRNSIKEWHQIKKPWN